MPSPPPPNNTGLHADDDDLDDLDDVLEQFHPAKPTAHTPAKPAPNASSPVPTTSASSSEKQKQPASSPPPPPATAPENALSEDALSNELAQFAEEMEKMMRQLGEGGAEVGAGPSSAGPAPPPPAEESGDDAFQRTIRQAMEKLKASDDTLKADAKGGEDTLEGLLASLGDLGGEGEEGLEGMMETLMAQLMSKEILYEPLKELDTKYPDYLARNAETLPPEDLTRYTAQKSRVAQLVAFFEKPEYKDEDSAQAAEVLRLMNEIQSNGSPPTEIMGAMPPGFDMGTDGLPNLPEGCIIA